MTFRAAFTIAVASLVAGPLGAQANDTVRVDYSAARCPNCAEWNAPIAPRKLFGNVQFVGTRGLSAILLTSPGGHVLIDAGIPQSAEPIIANIRRLGFLVEDIRLIVTSHVHYDHAGGVAALQQASGAQVAASPASASVLERGESGPDDPQYGLLLPYPAVTGTRIRKVADGDTLQVGGITIRAHFTGGHTPGGTSWSWRSCEAGSCLDFVYADSQTPISSDGFMYTKNTTYPTALADFARGHATLETLSCDVLITPHPSASRLWERLAAAEGKGAAGLRDPEGCRKYAANAREQLRQRVARENAK